MMMHHRPAIRPARRRKRTGSPASTFIAGNCSPRLRRHLRRRSRSPRMRARVTFRILRFWIRGSRRIRRGVIIRLYRCITSRGRRWRGIEFMGLATLLLRSFLLTRLHFPPMTIPLPSWAPPALSRRPPNLPFNSQHPLHPSKTHARRVNQTIAWLFPVSLLPRHHITPECHTISLQRSPLPHPPPIPSSRTLLSLEPAMPDCLFLLVEGCQEQEEQVDRAYRVHRRRRLRCRGLHRRVRIGGVIPCPRDQAFLRLRGDGRVCSVVEVDMDMPMRRRCPGLLGQS